MNPNQNPVRIWPISLLIKQVDHQRINAEERIPSPDIQVLTASIYEMYLKALLIVSLTTALPGYYDPGYVYNPYTRMGR